MHAKCNTCTVYQLSGRQILSFFFSVVLLFICYFIFLVLCSLAKLSSLYRLCDVEWKGDHEGEVLEGNAVTYYEGPSNLSSLGEITDRSIAIRIPDTHNQDSNQNDNSWIIPKNSRQKLSLSEHGVYLNHALLSACFRYSRNVYTHNREK